MTPRAFHGKEGVAGSSPAEGFVATPRPHWPDRSASTSKSSPKSPLGAKRGPQRPPTNLKRRRGRVEAPDPFLPGAAAPRAVCSEALTRGRSTRSPAMDNPLADPPPQLDWPASLMIAAEVAGVLRITPKTVRQHIRRGSLRALRIDGAGPYRVRAEDAQQWAERPTADTAGGTQLVDRYAREQMRTQQPTEVRAAGRRRRRAGVSHEPREPHARPAQHRDAASRTPRWHDPRLVPGALDGTGWRQGAPYVRRPQRCDRLPRRPGPPRRVHRRRTGRARHDDRRGLLRVLDARARQAAARGPHGAQLPGVLAPPSPRSGRRPARDRRRPREPWGAVSDLRSTAATGLVWGRRLGYRHPGRVRVVDRTVNNSGNPQRRGKRKFLPAGS
jgi:excisionase family DNA binding protein